MMPTLISRRELLKRASLAGAVAVVPVGGHLPSESSLPSVAPQAVPSREPYEHLTAMESDVLEAMVARIVPTDANGPGAKEARAARYIDRALGGALASSRPLYGTGLAAVDARAQSTRGKAFTALSPDEQDVVLSEVETGSVPGFADAARVLCARTRTHHPGHILRSVLTAAMPVSSGGISSNIPAYGRWSRPTINDWVQISPAITSPHMTTRCSRRPARARRRSSDKPWRPGSKRRMS